MWYLISISKSKLLLGPQSKSEDRGSKKLSFENFTVGHTNFVLVFHVVRDDITRRTLRELAKLIQ